MTQLKEELLNTQEVAEMHIRYDEKGVDFEPRLDSAIRAILDTNPTVKGVLPHVLFCLKWLLQKELKKRPAKTRVGRWIRWLFGVSSAKSGESDNQNSLSIKNERQ